MIFNHANYFLCMIDVDIIDSLIASDASLLTVSCGEQAQANHVS